MSNGIPGIPLSKSTRFGGLGVCHMSIPAMKKYEVYYRSGAQPVRVCGMALLGLSALIAAALNPNPILIL